MSARRRPPSRTAAPSRRSTSLHGSSAPDPATARLLDWLAFAILAAFAVVLLVIALGPHRVGDYFTETDFYGAYAEGARLVQRGVLDPSRYGVVGPGYDVALALVGLAIPDLFQAAELLSVVAMVGALFLWHRMLRRRAGPRLAVAALALMVVNGTVLRYGFSTGTDAYAFALQAAALALLLGSARPRVALAAGAVAGLAFLTRYTAVYLLPAGLLAALLGGTPQPDRRRAGLAFALGFVLPVAPWVLWSLGQGARFSFQLHHNIAYDVFARARGITWDDYQRTLQPEFKGLWDVIRRDPAAVAQRELFNVWDHLRLDVRHLMGLAMAIAAAAGLVLAWRDRTLGRLWPLLAAGALLFLALVPAFYSERYSLPLLPIYATLAGAAFASPRFALPVGRVWLKSLLIVVPLALAALASVRGIARVIDQLPVEVLDAARVLEQQARPDDRVMARKPHVAFHAGVQPQAFPFARDLAELADDARRAQARWLFFSWPEAEMRPAFAYLLDTSATVPGLAVRHSAPRRPAVLYEIGPEFGRDPAWLANDTTRTYHMARARLRINGNDLRGLVSLGIVETARGRPQAAVPWLERALRVSPDHLDALLALGEAWLVIGQGDRAAVIYERAEVRAPGDVRARTGRGWASLVQRRPREAAELWRPIVAVTRDPATLQRMIELYAAIGDRAAEAEARASLARARAGS